MIFWYCDKERLCWLSWVVSEILVRVRNIGWVVVGGCPLMDTATVCLASCTPQPGYRPANTQRQILKYQSFCTQVMIVLWKTKKLQKLMLPSWYGKRFAKTPSSSFLSIAIFIIWQVFIIIMISIIIIVTIIIIPKQGDHLHHLVGVPDSGWCIFCRGRNILSSTLSNATQYVTIH